MAIRVLKEGDGHSDSYEIAYSTKNSLMGVEDLLAEIKDEFEWLETELDDYISGELDNTEYSDHIRRVSKIAKEFTARLKSVKTNLHDVINSLDDDDSMYESKKSMNEGYYRVWYNPYGLEPDEEDAIEVSAADEKEARFKARTLGYVTSVEEITEDEYKIHSESKKVIESTPKSQKKVAYYKDKYNFYKDGSKFFKVMDGTHPVFSDSGIEVDKADFDYAKREGDKTSISYVSAPEADYATESKKPMKESKRVLDIPKDIAQYVFSRQPDWDTGDTWQFDDAIDTIEKITELSDDAYSEQDALEQDLRDLDDKTLKMLARDLGIYECVDDNDLAMFADQLKSSDDLITVMQMNGFRDVERRGNKIYYTHGGERGSIDAPEWR